MSTTTLLPPDTWDLMSKTELIAFLAERQQTAKASATRKELADLCRKAAISHFLRRREDDHKRALAVLRGRGYGYTIAEAVQVIEELIVDANAQGRALNYAHMQLHRLQQTLAPEATGPDDLGDASTPQEVHP